MCRSVSHAVAYICTRTLEIGRMKPPTMMYAVAMLLSIRNIIEVATPHIHSP